jgi:hypothetical protein
MNYPNNITANDIPDAPDLDVRLDDWAKYDPDGYDAALRETIDADERHELLGQLMSAGFVHRPHRWHMRMLERLDREVAERRAWFVDFVNRFSEAD